MSSNPEENQPRRPGGLRQLWRFIAVFVVGYLIVAYVLAPGWWWLDMRRRPNFAGLPTVTHTHSGLPGDPLNVALIGTRDAVQQIFQKAGWYAADPLDLRDDVKIAEDTVLERPYDAAPVSSLYLFGRREDLAFEKPVGHDPRQRHHVRFWQTPPGDSKNSAGAPVWIGAVTFDQRVGFSHTTGQITHHIAPNVDAERDDLMSDLQRTGLLQRTDKVPDFQPIRTGKNGGGDPWETDGMLLLGRLHE